MYGHVAPSLAENPEHHRGSLAENPEHHRDGNEPRKPDPQQLPAAHAAFLRLLCGLSFSRGWSHVLRHRPSRLEGDKRRPTVSTEGSISLQEHRTLRTRPSSKPLLFGKYSLPRPRRFDLDRLVNHLLFGCPQVDDLTIFCRLVHLLFLYPAILPSVHKLSFLLSPTHLTNSVPPQRPWWLS